jgi:predicted negative regulator of RcsB-dependent stress response
MANHLDLEEQEQLDQIKHFWKQYGNLITWVLIAVLGAYAAWNAYQYWQRNQAAQAAALYDELDRSVKAADAARVERAFVDMKDKFGSTTYAHQSAFVVANFQQGAGKPDAAKAALSWLADKSSDAGYQATARLRLADLQMQAKSFDEALKLLEAPFPASFEPMVADRRGDVLMLQGKRAEAAAAYTKAYEKFDERVEYRRLVEVKLNALGVDPQAASAVSVSSSAAPAVSGASR